MPFAGYKNFAACVKANSSKKDPQAYCATIMRATEAGMNNIIASELVDVSEAEFNVDEATGRMSAKVHLIKAGHAIGKNRNYRASALQKAAKEGVYNGLRMFVNHSDKPPTRRNLSELVSAVESTEWNPKTKSIDGDVVFFNKDFFDYAQAAKKHIGVSADHRIRVNVVQEGTTRVENVEEIVGARSVDWVVYPAAGGEVISFAKESEGENEVEWNEVTLDQLKANAPAVLEQFKAEVTESMKDPEEKDPPEDKKDEKDATETMTREEVAKFVQEQISGIQESQAKKDAATKKYREYVAKSGLPARTQARIVNLFQDAQEYVEADATSAVDDAKAELKEAGVGPRIRDMGNSSGKDGETSANVHGARESVESFFHMNDKKDDKKKATSGATSGEES